MYLLRGFFWNQKENILSMILLKLEQFNFCLQYIGLFSYFLFCICIFLYWSYTEKKSCCLDQVSGEIWTKPVEIIRIPYEIIFFDKSFNDC